MPPKRPLSPSNALVTSPDSDIYVSSTIHDRDSIFIARFSPTHSPRSLQSLADHKSASHRILAWRRPSTSQRTLVPTSTPYLETGFDDDGESYAGKRVLKVLEDYKVEGSLVVARWYGGILLGPVRFTHIENVAKEAVREYLQVRDSESAKRRRVDQEQERLALVKEMKRRDESIKLLRSLLDQMTNADKKDSSEATAKPVTREVDYEALTFERLRQMDKARDNTIAFLLKRIDEAEEKVKREGKKEHNEVEETKDKNQDADDTKLIEQDER